MKGAKIPKQFLELGGKPILAHTIQHFQDSPEIDSIVIVSIASGIDRVHQIIKQNNFNKVRSVVPGGVTGQQSIYYGLLELEKIGYTKDNDIVLIHDGVRPLIDHKTIEACIQSVKNRGCTATIAPSVETVIIEKDEKVETVMNRSRCKLARAPQGFFSHQILSAHRQAIDDSLDSFIDSISLMAHYGYEIFTIEGPADNIKITTKRDFFAFKGYMDYKEMNQLWEN